MALKRANIFVSGNVQTAGFRGFVKNLADSLEIKGYAGEFVDFERRGEDVPKKATLDDLLKVMISIDNKFGRFLESLGK